MRHDKPMIGVCPLYDAERDSVWMIPGYLDGIAAAGGIPIVLPRRLSPADRLEVGDELDGLLLTGGDDVSPAAYGEPRAAACGEADEIRDESEVALLRDMRADDKPVLGICRGIQLMNVAMGGTLWQDLPSQCASDVEHHMSPPYDRPVHDVSVLEGTPLSELWGQARKAVNSYHHQAIKELAAGLSPMAVSDDGLVEAVWDRSRSFLWGVQWHPELTFRVDSDQLRVFEAFVSACEGYRSQGC